MIRISRQIIDGLIGHAHEGLPEEVCGYLVGTDRDVVKQYRLTNTDHSPEHFSFDPSEQFKVVREARKEGLVVLANYHSHPQSPARPSIEDIRLAYDPEISYVIVSLAYAIAEVKSFIIRNGTVEKEEIQIID